MSYELLIQNQNNVYMPVLQDDVSWETERKGAPGRLTFKLVKDDVLKFDKGNPVRFKKDENNVFYGFIFETKRDKRETISVTAYDQLRYLKNKDTYVYTNKRADEVIQMLANDFLLNVGILENTVYKIPKKVEDNKTLFDITQNALDDTLSNTGEMYVLYDDFGKLSLKNTERMKLGLVIDEETGENYDYTDSIDSDTYNQIKLAYDNEDTGKREIFIAKDSNHINEWGLLQFFEKIDRKEGAQEKANKLLQLYNEKKKGLTIKNAIGDVRVRGGSYIIVNMNLGDMKLQNFMLVEKVKHAFKNGEHFMDLTLRGHGFYG